MSTIGAVSTTPLYIPQEPVSRSASSGLQTASLQELLQNRLDYQTNVYKESVDSQASEVMALIDLLA